MAKTEASPGVRVEVESCVLKAGRREPIMAPVKIIIPAAAISVAELIRLAVELQVQTLAGNARVERAKVAEAKAAAQRLLDRQYLDESEVARQAAQGAVRMPSGRAPPRPDAHELDSDREVRRARLAFEDGLFQIFVDGAQASSLSQMLAFRLGARVVFLRLTPLTGG